MISKGANVNAIDYKGKSPLHYNCSCGLGENPELVSITNELLQNGAKVNLLNHQTNILYNACKLKKFNTISALLKKEANPNEVCYTDKPETPLEIAESDLFGLPIFKEIQNAAYARARTKLQEQIENYQHQYKSSSKKISNHPVFKKLEAQRTDDTEIPAEKRIALAHRLKQ